MGYLLTLIASARLHRLDPEVYLRDVFRVLPHWPRDRYLELAPRYWRITRARLRPDELELFGRRRTAVKVLFADRTGVCVFYKRLDANTFRILEPMIEGDTARLIDERALDDLIDGLELALATSDRWCEAMDLTLRPLRKAVRVAA